MYFKGIERKNRLFLCISRVIISDVLHSMCKMFFQAQSLLLGKGGVVAAYFERSNLVLPSSLPSQHSAGETDSPFFSIYLCAFQHLAFSTARYYASTCFYFPNVVGVCFMSTEIFFTLLVILGLQYFTSFLVKWKINEISPLED